MADMVQKEVRSLIQSALEVALLVIRSNPTVLEGLGSQLEGNCPVRCFMLKLQEKDRHDILIIMPFDDVCISYKTRIFPNRFVPVKLSKCK